MITWETGGRHHGLQPSVVGCPRKILLSYYGPTQRDMLSLDTAMPLNSLSFFSFSLWRSSNSNSAWSGLRANLGWRRFFHIFVGGWERNSAVILSSNFHSGSSLTGRVKGGFRLKLEEASLLLAIIYKINWNSTPSPITMSVRPTSQSPSLDTCL